MGDLCGWRRSVEVCWRLEWVASKWEGVWEARVGGELVGRCVGGSSGWRVSREVCGWLMWVAS